MQEHFTRARWFKSHNGQEVYNCRVKGLFDSKSERSMERIRVLQNNAGRATSIVTCEIVK